MSHKRKSVSSPEKADSYESGMSMPSSDSQAALDLEKNIGYDFRLYLYLTWHLYFLLIKTLTFNSSCLRARPCAKVSKSQGMADVTSSRGAAPPSTSQTTSTKTAPSTPAPTGAAAAATPPVPESTARTRVESPLVIPSSSEGGTHTSAPQAPLTPQESTPTAQLHTEPAKSATDYSRLRISDDKSFNEAYIEAVELNDQASRLKDEEQAALRSLEMIHNVSALNLYSLCVLC